ncbi:MAG: DUF1345 domain-containing protein [Propionibacteriaceae bacterium]|nr:DUF1345 domain-containing protein [Propionibacteriaceae bacterium]
MKVAVPHWHNDARWRLVLAVCCGVATAVLVWFCSEPAYAPLLGWTIVGAVYCLVTWGSIGRMDPDETAAHATREVPGGFAVHLLLVCAALASLAGIAFLVMRPPTSRLAAAAVTLVVVVASWATIQTLHALQYAREYYRTGGGIDFHSPIPPQYSDFAYVSFTVGMSFAISDTDLSTASMRRIALWHAMLAYLFGTVFVAALINILASLSA